MDEEKDQLPEEESTEEETEETSTEEETKEEESEKAEEEPKSTDEALELARALQKGYTLTRQELSIVRQNQEAILEKLGKKEEVYGEDEEPLTAKKLNEILKQQEEQKSKEAQRIDILINSQIDELKAQGTIKSQEDEDALLQYAVKHKIRDLSQAAILWEELKEAQRTGEKAKAKTKVQQEAGSKIGTSQKTKIEKEQGINYEEIATKDMSELIEE